MELRKVEVQTMRGYNTIDNEGKSIYVEPKMVKGYFHCWEHYKNEDISEIRAVVELEDGTVRKFDTSEIKFSDKPE